MSNRCVTCNIEFNSTRKDAKFCSPNCRVTFSRKSVTDNQNVTDNVTDKHLSVTFKFTIKSENNAPDVTDNKKLIRSAKYWYNVPLAAVPVLQEGWPDMPSSMNGRQYFLWWKNDFRINDTGEPIILNPFPVHDNVKYVGGPQSRAWGA